MSDSAHSRSSSSSSYGDYEAMKEDVSAVICNNRLFRLQFAGEHYDFVPLPSQIPNHEAFAEYVVTSGDPVAEIRSMDTQHISAMIYEFAETLPCYFAILPTPIVGLNDKTNIWYSQTSLNISYERCEDVGNRALCMAIEYAIEQNPDKCDHLANVLQKYQNLAACLEALCPSEQDINCTATH